MTDQLRELLPGWVEWLGPALHLSTVTLTVGLFPLLSVPVILRRWDPGAHWTERARIAHAARVAVAMGMVTVPIESLMLPTLLVGPLAPFPAWLPGVIGAVTAFSISAVVGWRLERRVLGQPLPEARRHVGVLVGRWVPLVGVIVLAMVAPARLTSPWMLAWLAVAVAVGIGIRLLPLLWVRLRLAEPADDRVARIVQRASAASELSVQTVLVVDSHLPNAFAFPWLGTVAFTSRAVEVLTDDELEAVALHELSHMAEPAPVSFMRQAIHFIWIPIVAIRPLHGSLGPAGPVVVLLTVLIILAVFRRTAVRLETRSDQRAVENSQSSVYGAALEKLYRIGLIPAVRRRASHGQLHDRLRIAGSVPDFAPPAPPPRRVLAVCGVVAVLLAASAFLAPWLAYFTAGPTSPTPALLGLSLGSYGTWPLQRLGQLAEIDGDLERAAVLYAGAARLGDDPAIYPHAIHLHALSGRCKDAASALADLQRLGGSPEDLSVGAEWVDWCETQSRAGS